MPGRPANVVRFTTTAAGADQFASVLERLVEHVNAEQGTTMWFAGRNEDDPASFFLVDIFTDLDGRKAHFEGDAAALVISEGGPLLEGRPEISALRVLASKNA